MHRPGIEPGAPTWQAGILPLNQKQTMRVVHLTEKREVVLEWMVDLIQKELDAWLPELLEAKVAAHWRIPNSLKPASKIVASHVVEATISTRCFQNEEVFIPRIPLIHDDKHSPLHFKRLQFPIRVSFAMSINKAQGQSLKIAGIDLEQPCLSHGQLYVDCSRVGSGKNLYVLAPENKTSNFIVASHVVEATILTGCFQNEEVFIPRIPLIHDDKHSPLHFKRLQVPIRVSFAMSINKAQGQSLKIAGIDLEQPCFSHGQLYVECSRVGSGKNLYVLAPENKTSNFIVASHVVEATILTGCFQNEEVFIPRIPLIHDDKHSPLHFKRLQFPIRVSFAMSINKAQGQSLKIAGIDLEQPCFSHGQLYVDCSRVGSGKNLYVLAPENKTSYFSTQSMVCDPVDSRYTVVTEGLSLWYGTRKGQTCSNREGQSGRGEFSSTSLHLGRSLTVLTEYRQSWSRQSGKLGNVHTKNEGTVALGKFREQIEVELGAKDGDRRVLTGLHGG
ncbi:KLHDC10 [Cordylochernes scorpioides]|uniref:KLHDC10 n=1 Tax=Cordylochernes scorpioides TaxID=51811 RepID=A0ABY6LCI7_9ARAC|nr:KLHDC10 [Cordylochernes scorpioides]